MTETCLDSFIAAPIMIERPPTSLAAPSLGNRRARRPWLRPSDLGRCVLGLRGGKRTAKCRTTHQVREQRFGQMLAGCAVAREMHPGYLPVLRDAVRECHERVPGVRHDLGENQSHQMAFRDRKS